MWRSTPPSCCDGPTHVRARARCADRRRLRRRWRGDFTAARDSVSASLDADGNLRGHIAGQPFPPDAMTPDDPQNGARWAWNLEYRWRGLATGRCG